jgi:predicted RNA-binding protein YlxR (DUF448 family)
MNITKKKNKEVIRRCIATGEALQKHELLRIVRTPTGTIEIDVTGKLNGRGAYVKKDLSILPLLKKNQGLKRALKCDIPSEFYITLEEVLHG